MEVTLLPSAVDQGGDTFAQYLTSYLINDAVAVDAGSLGFFQKPAEQCRIKHIFLSHSHIDHLASLPTFVDNTMGAGEPVTVHGGQTVLDTLRRDIFNGRVWPEFLDMQIAGKPMLKLSLLEPRRPVKVHGLTITPVGVNHVVPTLGFLVQDDSGTIVIASDTGPTQEIWDCANAAPNFKAVFLEAAFPDPFASIAEAAKHLTPGLLAREVKKINGAVRIIVVHIKARYRDQVIQEIGSLGLSNVEIGVPGKCYRF